MRLTANTLARLTGIITGDLKESPYRSGPELIDFFYDFGERDLYGPGFPSRGTYVAEKLKRFNGSERMRGIVANAFEYFDKDGFNPEAAAAVFNNLLTRDGYKLIIEYGTGWMEGSEYVRGAPRFEVRALRPATVVPAGLLAISHEAIAEQVSKANARIESGDFAGAIASCYTLVENLLKLILHEAQATFKEDEGDIRALYKTARDVLNLNPSAAGIEEPLKPILDGLQKLVGGLYEISNKASDRHARKYNPARHHARLAVSTAFALCDFLIESRTYQSSRRPKS